MRKLRFGKMEQMRIVCIVFAFCIAAAVASPAQTYSTLFSFDSGNGGDPLAGVIQGDDGNFYGVTWYGKKSDGTVFKLTPSGALNTLHTFCSDLHCTDGALPFAGVMQAANGVLYGTAARGGIRASNICANSTGDTCGVIFQIATGGGYSVLYAFCQQTNCADGDNPQAKLVQGRNGDIYGTAGGGGANGVGGTVFEVTASGKLTTLHSFCAQTNCSDGAEPNSLILGVNGNFYGTTATGGNLQYGTFFEITPGGKFTSLYSFCSLTDCADGAYPNGIVQAANGNFYGTTLGGHGDCIYGCGIVFELTPSGKLTTLYQFCSLANCADGYNPRAGLVQGTDGNLYGTTYTGGANDAGTIFQITTSGTLTTLYSFCPQTGCADGSAPQASLIQGTDGDFYGTTSAGGIFECYNELEVPGCGVVFQLSTGLSPFIQSNPTFGKVGSHINIQGTNLSGTTSVTFNGTPATFTVESGGTYLKATVPSGATTGAIEVTTPSGTLSSNVAFQVLP
jgi:uncharacterized repeat protein (TIGR03803 family)